MRGPAVALAGVLACLAGAAPACSPDESSVGAVNPVDGGAPREAGRDGRAPWRGWWWSRRLRAQDLREIDLQAIADLPLSAVTGTAMSGEGIVVGGVSSAPDLFWDAWLIPVDDGTPLQLAAIGDRLLAVDGDGAVWTTVVSEDGSGHAAYAVRLSPSDGAPSVLLSSDLPAGFSADRSVTDQRGGRLLIGTEERDGSSRLAVFAVDAGGQARRLACPPTRDSPLVLSADLGANALVVEVQYAASEPPTVVTVPITEDPQNQ